MSVRRISRGRALLVIAVVLGAIGLQAGHAAAPIVDISLGSVLSEDFEAGNGGFTASPAAAPAASWQHGVPTSGPGAAASGTKVWATNLAGQYFASECQGLVSPAINLAGATTAGVSFREWHHMESASTIAYDGGRLYVTTDDLNYTLVTPAGGYTSASLSPTARTCLFNAPSLSKGISGPIGTTPPAPVYTPVTTDLTAFAGQTVKFVIMFASDFSVQRDGWYIDDFAVTIDGNTTTQDFEADNGGFAVKNFRPILQKSWSYGTPTTGPGSPTNMWATNLHGNYGPTECSWIESPPITITTIPVVPNEAIPFLRAQLSWNQFFRTTTSGGGGVVQVGDAGTYTNLVPSSGYGGNPTSSLNTCLQDDTQASGGFVGALNTAGGAMTEYTADLTPYIGKTITLRYLLASTTSTLTDLGWYVDDINVEMFLTVGEPELPPLPGSGTNAPGWTSGGTTSWAYGTTTGDPAGETGYDTNPAGSYGASECGYIETPELPGPVVAADPTLTFDHWYEIESLFSTTTWDGGFVLASGDGGVTWSELTPDGGYPRAVTTTGAVDDCKATYGLPAGGTYSGNKSAQFDPASFDLSSLAAAPTVRLRFVFASDSSVQYDGWSIKNIVVAGIPLLPPTA